MAADDPRFAAYMKRMGHIPAPPEPERLPAHVTSYEEMERRVEARRASAAHNRRAVWLSELPMATWVAVPADDLLAVEKMLAGNGVTRERLGR